MNQIKGIARIKFLSGKLDEWKRLTADGSAPLASEGALPVTQT